MFPQFVTQSQDQGQDQARHHRIRIGAGLVPGWCHPENCYSLFGQKFWGLWIFLRIYFQKNLTVIIHSGCL